MNLMWFENFWIVGGAALPFVLVLVVCLFFVFVLLSMLILNSSLPSNFNSSFTVAILQVSVPTSPFSGLIVLFLSKGSNWGAFAPFSNWDFEPYSWVLWRNPLGFEFLITGSNWHFGTDRWEDYKNPLGLEFLRTCSHWEFKLPWSECCRSLW